MRTDNWFSVARKDLGRGSSTDLNSPTLRSGFQQTGLEGDVESDDTKARFVDRTTESPASRHGPRSSTRAP